MAKLLENDLLNTGVYGMKHRNHSINECRKMVARLVRNSSEAIFELVINDKNIYKENSKHDQIDILNEYINKHMEHLDIDTYKRLKNGIGHFVINRKKN